MSKILIIGGGLSGLVAAYELAKKGQAIEIFEKDNQLGGLAGSFSFNGTMIEKFYHHFFKTDSNVLNLLRELGLDEKISWLDSSLAIYYRGKAYSFRTPLDLLKFKPLKLWDKMRLGFSLLYLQRTNNWQALAAIPAEQWLKKHCGLRAYEIVWQPLLEGKFHQASGEISMAWFWARIHTRGKSRDKGKSGEKLGYLKGSLQILIDALKTECEKNGVKFHFNAELVKIISRDKKIILSNGEVHGYDRLICAIPSNEFYQSLADNPDISPDYLNKLKRIKYLGVICAIFSSPQSLGDYYWYNINDPASPFLAFIQHTNLVDKTGYDNENIYYLGSYLPTDDSLFAKSETEIETTFFSYLKRIFPAFTESAITAKRVFKQKNAQHVVDCAYLEKIPEYRIPGTDIYLLNFSQIFPEDRGINFAIREAKKLSARILCN
ncbi:MAG: NAD(P)/FAD-dependent oxidoreductase [Patescibacteria group bacterium]|nr:NAD(P)/FAD-dependent oxidoreductase [Patescibacteria group bacterium]